MMSGQSDEYGAEGPQTLNQLKPGEYARVLRVEGEGPLRRRLMDMGLVRGVEVELVKAAPLGDPLDFRLRGYHLALRRSEAARVRIEMAEGR